MKPVRKIPPKCKTCRFFSQDKNRDGITDTDIADGEGLCRRHAPRAAAGDHGEWFPDFPRVYDTDWCGEWQGKGGK